MHQKEPGNVLTLFQFTPRSHNVTHIFVICTKKN